MRAAIALGSNLPSRFGPPPDALAHAVHLLGLQAGTVTAISRLHTTAPVGYTAQPDFTNAALVLETQLAPLDLLHTLQSIERSMGRDRSAAPLKGPRIIDLDLLLYEDLVLHHPELTLPHPAMHERAFVLQPLAEIAPGWVHPTLHRTVAQLLAALPTLPIP